MTKNLVGLEKADKSNEKAVIDALLNNARKSVQEISKEVGITRQTVSKIIKNLEKKGMIWGYSTVIKPGLFENNLYIALIKIKEEFDIGELIRKMENYTNIEERTKQLFWFTSYLHGRFDFITGFYAPNITEAEKLFNKMIKPFRKHISEIHILQPLITFRDRGIVNPNAMKEINEFF